VQKVKYIPDNINTVIINDMGSHCEIMLDGQFVTVPKEDLEEISSEIQLSSFEDLKENVFLNCIKYPLSDILYSYNTNRLTPEPHQYKPLIKFLNSENNRILIADEVGLGKTIEAGMILKEIDKREDLKVTLIVVPSSLTYKWKEEMKIRFDEYFEIKKTNQFLAFIDDFEEYGETKLINEKIIISYHTLRDEKVMKKIKNSFFEIDFLIMDEAHTMRNQETTTFDSGELITSISEHIVFLTATPVQNKLSDLFNILSLLDEDYFKDYGYFERMIRPNRIIHKLIAYIRNNHNLDEIKDVVSENNNEQYSEAIQSIFHDILTSTSLNSIDRISLIDRLSEADHLSFIINRSKKKDVGLSTPRNAKSAIINVTKEERDYYDAVIEFVKFLNPDTPQGFITIMPERMASSSMKASLESFKAMKREGKLFIKDLDDLEDYYEDINIEKEAMLLLDDIIFKGDKIGETDSKFLKFEEILKDIKSENIKQIIVFSFFKKTLDYLENKLMDLGYSVGKIHGDFSTEDRFSTIKSFKHGDFDILLSSEVGSEGLDMQFCNVIINYDLPWNPMRVEQRIGRIDRIGQKFDKLHIFNLCIVGSIEDRIYNRLYSKLNIFEDSIGELEPILGELEKTINISKLINLSQEELDKAINLKELSIKRKELEIKESSAEFEKMLNEDINYQMKHDELLNNKKISTLQNQSRNVFLNYLNENNINHIELKEGSIKISHENLKKLLKLLKDNMSDKRKLPLQYREERKILQKLYQYKDLKISFETANNDEYQTLYLFLNHPIISIITKNRSHKLLYTSVQTDKYENGFAVLYRLDLQQIKPRSILKMLILNKDLEAMDEVDYFEFIQECRNNTSEVQIDFEDIKNRVSDKIIQSIEQFKSIESISQNKRIDIKINSISSYFDKQISKVERLSQQVPQEDVRRMRIGQVDNLKIKRDEKIEELEKQKEINSTFEILGIVEVVK
jgi:SNF2 family DNA or RNA helicase